MPFSIAAALSWRTSLRCSNMVLAPILILCLATLVAGQTNPTVKLDNGFLKGIQTSTMGGKPYYSFKNIFFAEPPTGVNRFKHPTPFAGTLGTEAAPHDSTRNGPICVSPGQSEEGADSLREKPLDDVIIDVYVDRLGLGQSAASALVDQTLNVIERLYDFPEGDLTNKTLGYVLESLLELTYVVSEDCLHLSVHTPVDPTAGNLTADLPVMVFIHGGAFMSGSQYMYDHARLGDAADVIVVSVNYRVGPLGFMCLDTVESPGNMGMIDQVLGLRWVQDNIDKFGGDKNRVTVFGESAGSASVSHLMLSRLGDGLFARAIGMSGSATSPWAYDYQPVFHAKRLAVHLRCTQDNHTAIVECMRDLSAEEIQTAFMSYSREERRDYYRLGFGGSTPCGQTHGEEKLYGAFETPIDNLAMGEYIPVPAMFGATAHEGTFIHGELYDDFLVPNNLWNDTEYFKRDCMLDLLRVLGVDQGNGISNHLENFYFRPEHIGNLELMTPGLVDFEGAFFIKASSYKMIEENSKYADSYFYSVDHASAKKSLFYVLNMVDKPPFMEVNGLPGVCHADDLMYVFNMNIPVVLCNLEDQARALVAELESGNCPPTNPLCFVDDGSEWKKEWGECIFGSLNEEEELWSHYMVKAWTNFAVYGTPTPDGDDSGLPHMDPFKLTDPKYLAFRANGPKIVDNYLESLNDVMEAAYPENDATTTTTAPGTTTTTSANSAETVIAGTAVFSMAAIIALKI